MKRKLVLKPDHPQLAEFLKTDQTFESYLGLLGKFMDRIPCDNSPRRPKRKHTLLLKEEKPTPPNPSGTTQK
jgi:hypothetical protein